MEGEDLELLKLTKNINQGFYVDAGCYHPLRLNNTYLLYKKKWNGLNIDLSRRILFMLATQYLEICVCFSIVRLFCTLLNT